MYESISNKDLQRTKKPHRCDWCGELIEAGFPAHYRAYRYNGEFLQSYQHLECYTAMMQSTEDFEDGDMKLVHI